MFQVGVPAPFLIPTSCYYALWKAARNCSTTSILAIRVGDKEQIPGSWHWTGIAPAVAGMSLAVSALRTNTILSTQNLVPQNELFASH